jgi:hypothetical protein
MIKHSLYIFVIAMLLISCGSTNKSCKNNAKKWKELRKNPNFKM